MTPPSVRPTYSRDQLLRYVSHIYRLPADQAQIKLGELQISVHDEPLSALKELQQHHLASIPFSNISLHYSQHHTISLDCDYLFYKLIERGLGGYCMESTGFFSIVLRSLGYQVLTCGGRVSEDVNGGSSGDYTGL